MKALFRADASWEIGTGHVTRCLTLASCLRKQNCEITFACRDVPGSLIAEISAADFHVQRESILDGKTWDWLVVDHYALDEEFELSMRNYADKILVIDDIANRRHDCDLLLDQNLYRDARMRYVGLVPPKCKLLLGPTYSLLRTEFIDARSRVIRNGDFRNLLVSFGGSDPSNETLKVIRALRKLNRPEISANILIGQSNTQADILRSFARTVPSVKLWCHTKRIAELMLTADLAIGGGGSTSWERFCLGLPSLVIAIADNQAALSQELADRGFQSYLGICEEVTVEDIADAIMRSITHYSDMVDMGIRSMGLVDGKGAERVVAAMAAL